VLDQAAAMTGSEARDHEAPPRSKRLMAPLVLLVQDERLARTHLRATLAEQGLRVVEAERGSEALSLAAAHNPDVVVLDFTLPDLNGNAVTLKLREWTPAPIFILAARDVEHEKIAALDAGANEYMVKPLAVGEFLARMRVWLRHQQRAGAQALTSVLDVGDLRIDFGRLQASVRGQEVRLTPMQYKLFATLMRNAGRVLTHEQILLSVWGHACRRETQYLRIYMRQLREKFERDPADPQYLVTEPGVGYRLRAA
jgi:two-component system, OmpR family, KDP operon response regulator KdpE